MKQPTEKPNFVEVDGEVMPSYDGVNQPRYHTLSEEARDLELRELHPEFAPAAHAARAVIKASTEGQQTIEDLPVPPEFVGQRMDEVRQGQHKPDSTPVNRSRYDLPMSVRHDQHLRGIPNRHSS